MCFQAAKTARQKAAGPDAIARECLLDAEDLLLEPLVCAFNQMLCSGVPEGWCEGVIHPISQSGDADDPANYRGITVTAVLAKLFDMQACCATAIQEKILLLLRQLRALLAAGVLIVCAVTAGSNNDCECVQVTLAAVAPTDGADCCVVASSALAARNFICLCLRCISAETVAAGRRVSLSIVFEI